jgi:predicted alpha/beta-fold hydrolase
VIKKIQKKYPERQLFGLGTSMGAGLILRYAMDTGDKCLFKAIVAVAAPFDYISCRAKLNSFWPYFGFADGFIVKSLKKQFNSVSAHLLMMKEDLDRMGIDMERVKDFNTSKEFDEEFTVKMVGYKSTQDYYEDASVGYDLSKIKVPTLSLNSEDDPIVPFKKDSARQITSNPLVLLAYTRVGGHIGFYTGWSPKRWYPAPCLEFLLACSP